MSDFGCGMGDVGLEYSEVWGDGPSGISDCGCGAGIRKAG